MMSCEIIPLSKGACSGKCHSTVCADRPSRLWIIAACEGMISLFSQQSEGDFSLSLREGHEAVFSSLGQFQQSLSAAQQSNLFDQLIIVGSASDIAWVHSAIPRSAALLITAEIKYPLLSGWFKDRAALAQALQKILKV